MMFVFLFFLNVVTRFFSFFTLVKQHEQTLQTVATEQASIQEVNTGGMLNLILAMLQVTSYFFLIAMLIAGFFYLSLALKREVFLTKEAIIVKRLNGSSPVIIASEIILEQFLTLPVLYGVSLFIANGSFLKIASRLQKTLPLTDLIPLSRVALKSPLIIVPALLLICLLGDLYFQLTKTLTVIEKHS